MIITEFDPEKIAVINPKDCFEPIEGFPEICIGIFSEKIYKAIAEKYHGEPICLLKHAAGTAAVYKINFNGTEIALMLPLVGAPIAICCIEEVFPLGGKYFVFAGSCGVLRHDIADGHLIIPTVAVRDEGTSYHYAAPADEIEIDPACVSACKNAMDTLGFDYVEGKTWTIDAFYRETRGKVEKRKEQGCICVEMECAALAAVAQFRDVKFAQFFWAADNLDAPKWDRRGLSRLGETIGDMVFEAAVEVGKNLRETGK